MVFYVEHIPALTVELFLPLGVASLKLAEIKGHMVIVGHEAVRLLSGELNHHIEDGIVILVDILQSLFRCDHRCFGKDHAVILRKNIALEFFKILMQVRAMVEHENTLGCGHELIIWQAVGL